MIGKEITRRQIIKQRSFALTEKRYMQIDGLQKTTIHGIYPCGVNSAMIGPIPNAVALGNL